jgi:molecular chaperone GrpE
MKIISKSKKTTKANISDQIRDLEQQLQQCQEREKRALADYQNLLRRQRQDRLQLIKMTNKDLLLALLQPFDYLQKSAGQLNDQGLDMALGQLQQALSEEGLEEIEVIGKKFDLATMEVVDKRGDGDKVVEAISKAYRLNGEVLVHAKVVIG